MNPRRGTPLPKRVQWALMLALLALIGLVLVFAGRACADEGEPVRVAILDEDLRSAVEQALVTAHALLDVPACQTAFGPRHKLEPSTFRGILFVDGRESIICRKGRANEYSYRGGSVVNVCPRFLVEPTDRRPFILLGAAYASIGVEELQGNKHTPNDTRAVRKACEVAQ